MRMIDADLLYRHYSINGNGQRIPEKDCDNFPITVNIAEIKKDIRNTPTIDAVPVIRCEQCASLEMNAKYSILGVQIFEPYWCHELERNVCTIGFCGYGAKMERGDDVDS